MLVEEQVHVLLKRCEELLDRPLEQIRGNLRNPETCAAAVWELLLIDGASAIGELHYEPLQGPSPDIMLTLPTGRRLWLEAKYIYPRFWREERQSFAVLRWLSRDAKRRGVDINLIDFDLTGDRANPAGPVRTLPDLHQRRQLLGHPAWGSFIKAIQSDPAASICCHLTGYSIRVEYDPTKSRNRAHSHGLVQEAPKRIQEHALFRALREKSRQCRRNEPSVVCICSDHSPALSQLRNGGPCSTHQAVATALRLHGSISGVMLVRIENATEIFKPIGTRQAHAELIVNELASHPLTSEDIDSLRGIDFNRWKFTRPIEKWTPETASRRANVVGSMSWRPMGICAELEIPAPLVIDALAGRQSLVESMNLPPNHRVAQMLLEGWTIEFCSFKQGDAERGEAPKVVLRLSPPFREVFRQRDQ